jgi:hypothetical protein
MIDVGASVQFDEGLLYGATTVVAPVHAITPVDAFASGLGQQRNQWLPLTGGVNLAGTSHSEGAISCEWTGLEGVFGLEG